VDEKEVALEKFLPKIENSRVEIHETPKTLNADLAFLLGALTAEGSSRANCIDFVNVEGEFADEFVAAWKEFSRLVACIAGYASRTVTAKEMLANANRQPTNCRTVTKSRLKRQVSRETNSRSDSSLAENSRRRFCAGFMKATEVEKRAKLFCALR
jgi:hypothetical protein